MARRPVLDLDAEKTINFTTKGQEFSGFYLGFKTVKNDLSKDGTSRIHIFRTDEGNVGIWGTKKLNDKLQGILDQTQRTHQSYLTYITYGGKVKLGVGKTQHLFDVDFDDEITQDLGTIATNSDQAETAPVETDDFDADIDDMVDAIEPVVKAALTRNTPNTFTKDHQAKVAAMLAKK